MNQSIPSEKLIYSNSCRLSIFFFWLTTHFVISNKSLLIKSKQTIFGILPIGQRSENIHYRSISSVHSSSKINIVRLLIGVYLFFGSFRLIQSPPFFKFGMIELIVGFLFLLHSYKSTLKIVNNSGQSTNIEVSFLESKKINAISRELNNQVANY
jgi:hypothetical protein